MPLPDLEVPSPDTACLKRQEEEDPCYVKNTIPGKRREEKEPPRTTMEWCFYGESSSFRLFKPKYLKITGVQICCLIVYDM